MKDLKAYLTDNITESRLLMGLYILSQVRYASFKQLKICKKNSINIHIYKKKLLQALSDLGFIGEEDGYYTTTGQTVSLLAQKGYPTAHLQKRTRGKFKSHQEKLTETILNFTNDPVFFTAFYPVFETQYGQLIPDACLVFFDKANNRYKLVMLEVENTEKDPAYLQEKRIKYDQIAKDYKIYSLWWKRWAGEFSLPFPELHQFHFEVFLVGNKEYNFGEGWLWQKKLSLIK